MRRGLAKPATLGALFLLWALPLAASLIAFMTVVADVEAWRAMLQHPQLSGALLLSIWIATAGLACALTMSLVIMMGIYGTPLWRRFQAFTGAALALPHLAFAIGFGFLIMPSGLLARILAGGELPPQWVTTQDPLGLSLIACLALKETPFLLAILWSLLARGDVAAAFTGQWRSARSLGHGTASAWLRVLLPQILPRLAGPIIIVWVYGATVVDMALVIGPTQPPPLAVIAWADLNHADAAINARGMAAAAVLTLVLAVIAACVWVGITLMQRAFKVLMSIGPSPLAVTKAPAVFLCSVLFAAYLLVAVMLVVVSLSGHWPYPELFPDRLQLEAWHHLWREPAPLFLSLLLALATSGLAIGLAVLCLEVTGNRFDRFLMAAAVLCLGLPALVIAGGQYRLFLAIGLTATLPGLWLAHFTAVFAYVFIVLKGPYRAFDPRWQSVANGLNSGKLRFWLQLKAPFLKAPLLMAVAIGFSVSMVQFVPAQLMAAGRFATLPMEAVTLASGGNRALTASYALALTLAPALVFLAAFLFSRPRWRQPWI